MVVSLANTEAFETLLSSSGDSTLALCAPKRVCRARDSPEAEAAARSAYRILCVRLDARV